ncbi:MAG: MG2 domain-containing protein, partial [Alphaproteobacteria bacterium]|nr:MG2 domain-containing protein [Alphaproteobacteria bacterium]
MLKYFKNAYVITGLIVVIAITTLVIYTTYGVKKINLKIDKDFATYISRYTSGVVSNKTTIKIVFIADLPSQITNNKDLQNLFEFSPKISGTVRWVNAATIEFIPQNTLPSGTLFTGKFFLKKLLKVPEKLGEFPLVFQTQTQVITTELNAFRPLNPSDKKLNFCAITFKTTDIMNNDQLESMVVVQGQKPKMTWQHEHDGKTHNLYLDPLERTNQSQEITIDFKNKNLTGYKLMPLTFTIPALSTFSIMKVYHQIVDDNNTISYLFSDPLLESQDLEGLISTSKHISFNFQRRSNKLTINSLDNYEGAISFEISAALSSVDNQKLSSTLKHEFYFPQKSPQIEFIGKGNIVPTNGTSLNIAFKAIKVKAVNLKIVKLFENNLPYFLQSHEISNTYNLKSFGKLVYKGEMPLIVKNAIDYNQWTNFSVDISKFITLEPGALYSVIMSFSKSQTIFNCSDSLSSESTSSSFVDQKIAYDATSEDNSYGDFNDDGYENYDDDNYYEHRNNPCYDAFYNSYNEKVFIQKNFFVSNFGIIAKGSSLNTYHIAISNLKTTDPEKNVDIKIYDFQNQLIQTVKTNHEGLAQVALDRKPFYLLAFKDDQRGYLKLNDANALSLSMFDISGEEIVEGFKGFIYAERGVWRPGDSIYLQFILQDKLKKIPEQYPVIMSLYTPLDKLYKKQVLFEGYKNHYDFRTATDENSPTGNWTVKIMLGSQVFTKTIKIETIKPNRIKMAFDNPQNILSVQHKSLSFHAHWLQGPPASNLKANIEGSLSENLNYFNKYPHYIFNDPSKKKTRIYKALFNNTLNNEGAAQFDLDIDIHPDEASGILNLKTVCRVFEKSGDFSEEVHRFDYAPFNNYVGFLLPNTSFWGAELKSDKENIIPIVLLDTKGLPASSDQVKIEVFDINANWWWSWRDEKSIQDFDQNVIQSLCFSDVTQIKNGKLMYQLQFPKKSYGRKFIKITDLVGGHSTGGFCWVDYDGWNWEANNNN